MATNQGLSTVENLSLPVPAGTASGDPVVAGTTTTAGVTIDVNGINGVALTDIDAAKRLGM